VTRDYAFDIDAPAHAAPMLSVFGGKITTYRKLAEHALEKLSPYFPQMTGPWTKNASLPGGDLPDGNFVRFLAQLRSRHPWLPNGVSQGYARRYGARAEDLLDGARSLDDLGRHFGATLYEREARFLIADEWANEADDILERRTKHGLHLNDAERNAFAAWVQARVQELAQ
jgi:glycerol-3-phosphate dehydrogenase